MADGEVFLGGDFGVAIPGADELAVVAAEDAVADGLAELGGDAAFEFYGEVGDAAARV